MKKISVTEDQNRLGVEPVEIELGGKVRTLIVNARAERIASKLFGASARQTLSIDPSTPNITLAATAALVHELADKADPTRVEKWLEGDKDPRSKFPELKTAVLEAYRRYYVAIGVIDDEEDDRAGEAEAPSSATNGG